MDVALLDINLPDKDGQYLIEKLKDKDIRVIVTTVKNDEDFIVKALDQGADDYLTKPFSLAILRARIDAVLRTIALSQDKTINYKDIKIDFNQSKVYFKGNLVDLTSLEYEILVLFIKNPHRVYTRSQLLEMFWEDRDKFVNDNTLTSTIKRIREKLDKEVISTVRGIGYKKYRSALEYDFITDGNTYADVMKNPTGFIVNKYQVTQILDEKVKNEKFN